MKQSTIVRAYKALNDVYKQKMPLSVSHKLWTLRNLLSPQWTFQFEKEQEVIKRHDPLVSPDGAVTFKSKEDEQACIEEYNSTVAELADLDIDLGDYKKIVLHFDDKIEMSGEDIDALKDFIEFVE